jgi:hypothetical protein
MQLVHLAFRVLPFSSLNWLTIFKIQKSEDLKRKKEKKKVGMVVFACNPSSKEAEAGGW